MAEAETETLVLKASDQATAPAQKAAAAFDKAGAAAEQLRAKIGGLKQHTLLLAGGITGLGFGFKALAEKTMHALKAQSSMEKGIASLNFSMLQWPKNISAQDKWNTSLAMGAETLARLEEESSRLAMPVEQLNAAYGKLAGPAFTKLGLSTEQTFGLLTKAAEGAKAFGLSGEHAAQVISRALITRTIGRGLDPFSDKLRVALGNMKKLSAKEIYDRMQKGLGDVSQQAEFMATGMDASLFRIRDFFESTLKGIGAPTIKYITGLLKGWTDKLAEAKKHGHDIVAEYGDKLLGAFKFLEKVTRALLDNWKEIAAIFVATKAESWIKGLGALGGAGKKEGEGAGGFMGAIGKFSSKLLSTTEALGGFYVALKVGAEILDEWQTKKLQKESRAPLIDAALTSLTKASTARSEREGAAALRAARQQFGPGIITAGGKVQRGVLTTALESLSAKDMMKVAGQLGGTTRGRGTVEQQVMMKIADKLEALMRAYPEAAPKVAGEVKPEAMKGKVVKAPVQNFGDVYITQDFKDADPDRVFIRFKNDLENQAENQTQSSLSEWAGP
jgi:hypothetical protein